MKPLDAAPAVFQTTSWSIVERAGTRGDEGRVAFADLCGAYWYPLYAFTRRRGQGGQDAEDAVQSFFMWMLESNVLERADRERGRFRSFLVKSFQQFLARQHRHDGAAKRKPDRPLLEIDTADGDRRFALEPSVEWTPERQFEHAWAMTVIERAMERLRLEYESADKTDVFAALRGSLTGDDALSGAEAAKQLGRSEGAVRVAVHRLRKRYGELLRDEVGRTLQSEEEIDDEIQNLFAAVNFS